MENQSSNYMTSCQLAKELSAKKNRPYSVATIEIAHNPKQRTERTRCVCLVVGDVQIYSKVEIVLLDRSMARLALSLQTLLRADAIEGSAQAAPATDAGGAGANDSDEWGQQ